MATTFTIPTITLPVGARTFGPAHPADAETSIVLTIDRTVTGGLNSLTSSSTLGVDLQQSNDGGVTWQDLGSWTSPGGLFAVKPGGSNITSVEATWNLAQGTSRQLQVIVTVSGPSSIVIAGTIVTQ